MEGTTCGTCRHWHKKPADPMQLGAPAQGDCRGAPPTPIGIATPHGLQVMVLYSTMPPEYPACAQHAPVAPPRLATTLIEG